MSAPLPSWINYANARTRLSDAMGHPSMRTEAESSLIEAFAEGDIRTRRVDWNPDTAERKEVELDPAFWLNGGARVPRSPLGHFAIDIEVSRRDFEDWLRPSGAASGSKRGRKVEYDWDGFWIELVRLANHPDGLDGQTKNALTIHMEEWFEERIGKSPATSSIADRVSRLFKDIALQ